MRKTVIIICASLVVIVLCVFTKTIEVSESKNNINILPVSVNEFLGNGIVLDVSDESVIVGRNSEFDKIAFDNTSENYFLNEIDIIQQNKVIDTFPFDNDMLISSATAYKEGLLYVKYSYGTEVQDIDWEIVYRTHKSEKIIDKGYAIEKRYVPKLLNVENDVFYVNTIITEGTEGRFEIKQLAENPMVCIESEGVPEGNIIFCQGNWILLTKLGEKNVLQVGSKNNVIKKIKISDAGILNYAVDEEKYVYLTNAGEIIVCGITGDKSNRIPCREKMQGVCIIEKNIYAINGEKLYKVEDDSVDGIAEFVDIHKTVGSVINLIDLNNNNLIIMTDSGIYQICENRFDNIN